MNCQTPPGRRALRAVTLALLAALCWPAPVRADRSVALIVDASGSMNGRLADGTVKMEAAKQAIEGFLDVLHDDLRLSFRAYGHGSPRRDKDCRDTELLVDFGAAREVRPQVIAASRALEAQGYTPITYAIELAAADLLREPTAEHVAVLVSDGLETCDGDPCAAARALKAANARLVVHTVGFGVDDATRFQLRCIADVTGGTYIDAEDRAQLDRGLSEASDAVAVQVVEEEGAGWLEIAAADMQGHQVLDAETQERVATISNLQKKVELPAGIYNVTFGNGVWKSVEIEAGETTRLEPGILEVRNADLTGHDVLLRETGEKVAAVSSFKTSVTLMPATFDVTFGGVTWPAVRVEAGRRTVLEPGILQVAGADLSGHAVTREGVKVGTVSSLKESIVLPPGSYEVHVGGQAVGVELAAGQTVRLERQKG